MHLRFLVADRGLGNIYHNNNLEMKETRDNRKAKTILAVQQ